MNINDFNNFETTSSYIHADLDTDDQPLWYVVDFKLNIINSELLKRENKKNEKETKNKNENKKEKLE